MPIYSFDGIVPVVDPSAYVHPTAVLIGDVRVGARCYVGPNASLRGDCGRIALEPGSNIQDNCVAHAYPGADTIVEEDGHVGHGAVLHGCRVGRNALVGINAVLMDHACVGESSLVAAMTFVRERMVIPPRRLVAGLPARIIRELRDEEIAWKSAGTAYYHRLAALSLQTLVETAALPEAEPGRAALDLPPLPSLHEFRATATIGDAA